MFIVKLGRREFVVCSLLALSGCIDTGEPTAEMAFELRNREVESDRFVLHGTLRAIAHRTKETFIFDDVAISLYNDDRTKIVEQHVGTVTAKPNGSRIDETVHADSVPQYIVIESPDFTDTDIDLDISGWRRTSEGLSYREYKYSSLSEKFG